jgi:DnaJ-class molecular chaperone
LIAVAAPPVLPTTRTEVPEVPKMYVCPCCDGQGLVHAESTEAEPLECAECDATGKVTREHRDDLLEWRHKCRVRRPSGTGVPTTER